MFWTVLFALLALVVAAALVLALAVYVTMAETDGLRYYGRPLEERRALKRRIAARGRRVAPLGHLLARIWRPKRPLSSEYKGVTGPGTTCSRASYAATERFQPDERDVFVATQMKCGTTWMQQLAYEVILRGHGDLGDAGHVHLYATSPWIESRHSVAMEDAPRLGEAGRRLIKTHMPTLLCPYSAAARYLYVTRHPVACFASIADFIRMLTGPFAPTLPNLLDWYCSDRMWWRSWPEHVDGWWRWAERRPNVLFLHYEEMLDDLPGVVTRVADFLDCPLTAEAHRAIVTRSGFDFMKSNEELFEMAPPNLFSELDERSFLQSGSRSRERGLSDADRERILRFCRDRLADSPYPAARFYPDVAE